MPRPIRSVDEKKLAVALGHIIRVARKRKGIKAELLAFEINVTPQTISSWETGKALPYPTHLLKASDVLGIRVSRIYAAAERLIWMQEIATAAKHQRESTDGRA